MRCGEHFINSTEIEQPRKLSASRDVHSRRRREHVTFDTDDVDIATPSKADLFGKMRRRFCVKLQNTGQNDASRADLRSSNFPPV